MHFVEAKSILTSSAGYPGLNVYRGCAHGCEFIAYIDFYCFAFIALGVYRFAV